MLDEHTYSTSCSCFQCRNGQSLEVRAHLDMSLHVLIAVLVWTFFQHLQRYLILHLYCPEANSHMCSVNYSEVYLGTYGRWRQNFSAKTDSFSLHTQSHNIVMTATLKKHEIIVNILQEWEETLMFRSDCGFCITISPDSLAWSPAWNFHWHLLNNKLSCKSGLGCCFLHWVTHQNAESWRVRLAVSLSSSSALMEIRISRRGRTLLKGGYDIAQQL